jgi:hypothetical protein
MRAFDRDGALAIQHLRVSGFGFRDQARHPSDHTMFLIIPKFPKSPCPQLRQYLRLGLRV